MEQLKDDVLFLGAAFKLYRAYIFFLCIPLKNSGTPLFLAGSDRKAGLHCIMPIQVHVGEWLQISDFAGCRRTRGHMNISQQPLIRFKASK